MFSMNNAGDYIYSEQLDGEQRKQKRLSLFFKDEKLSGIKGDFRPSSLNANKKSKETTVNVPPRDLDKTLWGKNNISFFLYRTKK